MHAKGVAIEPATPQDVPEILRLIKALAEYERLSGHVVATEERIRDALFGHKPAAEAIVARGPAGTIGFALFTHTFSTFLGLRGLYLEDVYVEPAWRGQGIGTALFASVAREAVLRGCGRLEWAVLDWNEPALNFYRRLGGPVPSLLPRVTHADILSSDSVSPTTSMISAKGKPTITGVRASL